MKNGNYSISSEYSIKKVTNVNEFKKLKTVWDNLAEKQGPFLPFLCFDWFKIWLDHFLMKDNLLILLLYKQEEIVAIAPLLIKEEKYKGINVRKIDLIGNVYSPIRYFLLSSLAAEEREKYFYLVFRFLREMIRNWDIIDLTAIPEERDCFDSVKRAAGKAWCEYVEYFCYGDWYSDEIKYSGQEYFSNLPQKIRKDILYCKRRLEKTGKYDFKVIREGDKIDDYMNFYYNVYSKSWQEKEGVGPNFHRDLAKVAIKNDWLRLGFLFFNNSPIASQFWVSNNGTAYILKTVYDQEYKKYSPGKILTSEMMKYVIDMDGVNTVDYVQGDEAYKEAWTPKRRERKGILIYNNNSIKGKALEVMERKILPVVNKNKHLRKFKESISILLR